ncbi:MAG: C39 family peptidase [Candidatus Dormiibacterota bacterium]
MAYGRMGAAAIVALVIGSAAVAASPLRAEAAMFRLPVGTQRMQMPLDCEATSLTIALASVGVHTTQQYVQGHFPTDLRAPVLGANGLPSQWGDPYVDFVGHVMGSEPGSNPHWATYAGWGAYAPVVAKVAKSLGVPVAPQLTGWNPQALYAAVEAGHPVLVWSTVNYVSETARTWTGWDGRVVPWTEAGHVVVLMGVDPTARTLEFSDPLTGRYNGATMAQFASTFNIYGDMAIVIERVAKGATQVVVAKPKPVRTHQVGRVTVVPAAVAPPFMSIHHVRRITSFSTATAAGSAAATLGILTDVTASKRATELGAWPFVATGLVAVIVAVALLGLFMRRRRRIDALGELHARRGSG